MTREDDGLIALGDPFFFPPLFREGDGDKEALDMDCFSGEDPMTLGGSAKGP